MTITITRLGVADVREFGLTWSDCEALLQQLGFHARIEIVRTMIRNPGALWIPAAAGKTTSRRRELARIAPLLLTGPISPAHLLSLRCATLLFPSPTRRGGGAVQPLTLQNTE